VLAHLCSGSFAVHTIFLEEITLKMHTLCKEKNVHAFMCQCFVPHLLRMSSSFFHPLGTNPPTTKRCKNQLFPSYLNETPQRILHKSLWSFSLVFESIGSLSSLSFFTGSCFSLSSLSQLLHVFFHGLFLDSRMLYVCKASIQLHV
jgi:hypothetical protein